jgi:cytosine/adenosine deaminase-related metal-dependent hydrolase
LHEETKASIEQSLLLLERWNGKADGRIRYCFAPRFAVSCTRELLETVGRLAGERGVMIHTHASENRSECQIVESETGLRNIAYLDQGWHHWSARRIGSLRPFRRQRDGDSQIHRNSRSPLSLVEFKTWIGIAPVKELLNRGISVSLGADGAACNNRLDMFSEMRLAALLQKTLHGPDILNAETALRMATVEGARALGEQDALGTLEAGKRADVIVVRLNESHVTPRADLASTLVYATQSTDVDTVIIDGELVMYERKLLTIDEAETITEANREQEALLKRAGLS